MEVEVSACVACMIGQYSNAATGGADCADCVAGSQTEDAAGPGGGFFIEVGASACAACAAGQFSEHATGGVDCSTCSGWQCVDTTWYDADADACMVGGKSADTTVASCSPVLCDGTGFTIPELAMSESGGSANVAPRQPHGTTLVFPCSNGVGYAPYTFTCDQIVTNEDSGQFVVRPTNVTHVNHSIPPDFAASASPAPLRADTLFATISAGMKPAETWCLTAALTVRTLKHMLWKYSWTHTWPPLLQAWLPTPSSSRSRAKSVRRSAFFEWSPRGVASS